MAGDEAFNQELSAISEELRNFRCDLWILRDEHSFLCRELRIMKETIKAHANQIAQVELSAHNTAAEFARTSQQGRRSGLFSSTTQLLTGEKTGESPAAPSSQPPAAAAPSPPYQEPAEPLIPDQAAPVLPRVRTSDTRRVRILLPESIQALLFKDPNGSGETVSTMAEETGCHIYLSDSKWPDTDEAVLNIDPRAQKSAADNAVAQALQSNVDCNGRLECKLLVSEGLHAVLCRQSGAEIDEIMKLTRSELKWIGTKPLFIEGSDAKEGDMVLKITAMPEDMKRAIVEIQDRQEGVLNRQIAFGRKAFNGEPGGVIAFSGDIGTWTEKERLAIQRQQDRMEKAEVKVRMRRYGLGDDETANGGDDDAIAQAKLDLKGTFRGTLLELATNKIVMFISLICILANLVVMWFEVDAGAQLKVVAEWLQYGFTVLFFLEALLNTIAIPRFWQRKALFYDALVCYAAFAVETASFFLPAGQSLATVLLLARIIRFYRFFRLIRNYQSARTVRVLLAGLQGALLNLVWITLFLAIIMYCGAILFRSLLKSGVASEDAEIRNLTNEYFSSVANTIMVLLETFMEGFDHSELIARVLLRSQGYLLAGIFWLAYQLLMKLVVVNLVAGLFIEQLTRSAKESDETSMKEGMMMKRLTYPKILRAFDTCDKQKDGTITGIQFEDGIRQHKDVADLLQIKADAPTEEIEALFQSLDHTGSGSLTFAEFAYGILLHRCGSSTLESMLFHHACKALVRQSAQAVNTVKDANLAISHSSAYVKEVNTTLHEQKNIHVGGLVSLRKVLARMNDKVEIVFSGLKINETADTSSSSVAKASVAASNSLVNVNNVREARDIKELMREMKGYMERLKSSESERTEVSSREVVKEEQEQMQRQFMEKFRREADAEIANAVASIREALEGNREQLRAAAAGDANEV